jgi:hypothetical protein
MMCASNKMIPDVVKMIRQARDMWSSNLGYAVSHCSEISHESMKSVWLVEPSVQFIDLCKKRQRVFGMEPSWARKRLRGFFCKVAAMLASPFTETMILDLDVVWLGKPDYLFESREYVATGTLFFRSRVFHYHSKRHARERINVESLLPYLEQHGVAINRQTIHSMAVGNGISFFWLHVESRLNNSLSNVPTSSGEAAGSTDGIGNKSLIARIIESEADSHYPLLSDFQDSSVILVDRTRHSRFLRVLETLLPSFAMGYGDKETFWVAATISGEPFAFEPFLSGQYGDCYGVQLHYDPRDAHLPNPENARPFYLNAEYFVEKELTCVGEFVRTRMVRPRLVTLAPDLRDSLAYAKSYLEAEASNYSCTCGRIGCVNVPEVANRYLMYVQWLTLSHAVKQQQPPQRHDQQQRHHLQQQWQYCVPIMVSLHREVNNLFLNNISGKTPPKEGNADFCRTIGCPQLPIELDMSLPWVPKIARYCEPVRFLVLANNTMNADSNIHDNSHMFTSAVREARSPHSKWNRPDYTNGTLLQNSQTKRYYLVSNNQTHLIPNKATFLKLGLEFPNAIAVPPYMLGNLPAGSDIKAM